jgi:hypothetical protein
VKTTPSRIPLKVDIMLSPSTKVADIKEEYVELSTVFNLK